MKNPQLFYNYDTDEWAIKDYAVWEEEHLIDDENYQKWMYWILADPVTMGIEEYLNRLALVELTALKNSC